MVLLMVWLVMPPISQTTSGRVDHGLKTVLPGRIRAMKVADRMKVNARSGSNWALLAFFHAKAGHFTEAESDLRAASERSVDERGMFYKVQALAVLGRKEEALELLLQCIDRGRNLTEIEMALDLKELRADPRFLRHVAKRGVK